MPRHDMTQEQIEAETERFATELAKAFLRDLRTAAHNAPYGKIVSLAEAVAVNNGREFIRQTFEAVIQEQTDIIEKKKKQRNAPAAENSHTKDTPQKQP